MHILLRDFFATATGRGFHPFTANVEWLLVITDVTRADAEEESFCICILYGMFGVESSANRVSFNSFESFLIGGLWSCRHIDVANRSTSRDRFWDSGQSVQCVVLIWNDIQRRNKRACMQLVLIVSDTWQRSCRGGCFVICNESELIENITFYADDTEQRQGE